MKHLQKATACTQHEILHLGCMYNTLLLIYW